MNVGYNQNQALLAGAPATYMPYSPSYSVPIQPQYGGPAPLAQNPMRMDSFESTRDKSVSDFAGGFFTGAGKAIYDMGRGVFFLGGIAGTAIKHPITTVQKVGGAVVHGVTHPLQTAETIVTLPFKVAKGVVKPYSQALQQGKYGEAAGRLAVDITIITSAMGGKQKPPPGQGPAPTPGPPPPMAPPTVSTPMPPPASGVGAGSGGISNNLGSTVGDTILEKIGNVKNVTGNGNTINVNIGNITVGGANGSTVSSLGGAGAGSAGAGLSGASQVVDDIGRVAAQSVQAADNVGVAAQAAANTGATTAQASQAVGAATAGFGAQSSTVGMRIGSGIDFVIGAPAKTFHAIGQGFQSVGRGIEKVGHVILHPIETLKGINPGQAAEWLANGVRAGGNGLANGILFTAHNPGQALIIAGAVGRGGKAAEDILMEMDLVR